MSTNCIRCVKNRRTGIGLLCDECRQSRLAANAFTPAQRSLFEKHETPAEFAGAVYDAVPGAISMDEAAAAIEKYNAEWADASSPASQKEAK